MTKKKYKKQPPVQQQQILSLKSTGLKQTDILQIRLLMEKARISFLEKKFTQADRVLLKELANLSVTCGCADYDGQVSSCLQ